MRAKIENMISLEFMFYVIYPEFRIFREKKPIFFYFENFDLNFFFVEIFGKLRVIIFKVGGKL